MMPIGVPKVPYRTPGEGGWQWVDIWNCLVRREGDWAPGGRAGFSCSLHFDA